MERSDDANPFRSAQSGDDPSPGSAELPPLQPPGLVGQVSILAVLMMVQAAGMIFLAVIFGTMSFYLPMMDQAPAEGELLLRVIFIVETLVHAASGGLMFTAATRAFRFRAHGLCLLALLFGLATSIGIYCAFTGLPLLIYGLIVLRNPSVRSAFQMGEQGYSYQDITRTFTADSRT